MSGGAVRVAGMASTSARVAARTRAREAQRLVLAARAERDKANMASLTEFFTAAEEIDAARRRQAEALAAIREREGTLTAAASLAGLTLGQARTLLAELTGPVAPSGAAAGGELGADDAPSAAPVDDTTVSSTDSPAPHHADASGSSESAG
ncbi:hypothetical protein A3Q40_03363 [Rhodococcus sp. PBTS 1]|nr:hypothetical protein A3Q40_03363 [Rhodococcus sp. PBTS 1]